MPVTSISQVLGSGTTWGGGVQSLMHVPVTLLPSVVPNENMALVIVESVVIPSSAREKVAVPVMKGLCGPFPAILPLALLYTLLPSGPPIRV